MVCPSNLFEARKKGEVPAQTQVADRAGISESLLPPDRMRNYITVGISHKLAEKGADNSPHKKISGNSLTKNLMLQSSSLVKFRSPLLETSTKNQ